MHRASLALLPPSFSQKRRDEDSQPKITAAGIFGRHRKLTPAAVTHILTQTMVEFLNGRITHNQSAALTRIAQLMLRTLENADTRPKLSLPLDSWCAEAAAILSGMGTRTAQTAEEPDTTL